ncbi:MAG: molybdate ABC transporter substrate-binding protein [Sandaracinus sp.]|nr:molybdate ABC transporter substrate-binding protein [Sandaracinus sp.]
MLPRRDVFALAFTLLLGCGEERAAQLRVMAAASLAPVTEALRAQWRASHDTELVFELGPSSRLVRQLKSGAPFDVLLTADAAWMDEARAEVEDVRVFARGRLVVIVPRGRHQPADAASLAILPRLALCAPQVPCGRYARAALAHEGAPLGPNVIEAPSASVALRWVRSGEVDAAVLYASDARDSAVELAFAFDADAHPPVEYLAAKRRGADARADAFLAMLAGDEVRALLRDAGFSEELP